MTVPDDEIGKLAENGREVIDERGRREAAFRFASIGTVDGRPEPDLGAIANRNPHRTWVIIRRPSMSLVTTGGIVSSIVPFDPTIGITAVATVMLALFVLMMIFPAVAPLVSSTWAEQLESPSSGRPSPAANGGETDESGPDESETDAGSTSIDREGASGSMTGTFTNEEIGKLVERADGKVIGTVASVDGETARVEPKPDVLDQVLVRLDRKEIGDPFVLEAESVREISDTRIHLERDFVRPTGGPTPDTNDSTPEADADDVSAATE